MTHPIHSADAERAAFEALFVTISESAANPRLFERVSDDRRYCSMEVEYAWLTYRAVRAAAQVGANGAAESMTDKLQRLQGASVKHIARLAAGAPAETGRHAVFKHVNDEVAASIREGLAFGAPAETPSYTEADVLDAHTKGYALGLKQVRPSKYAPAETPKPCGACGANVGERCRTMSDDQCDAGKYVVPLAQPDEPTSREALIACLGDDAVTLLADNPDDEMAQTMQEAAAMLEADGAAQGAVPVAIGWITTGDVEGAGEGAEIGDWDIEWNRKVIDAMPEFAKPETTYGVYLNIDADAAQKTDTTAGE